MPEPILSLESVRIESGKVFAMSSSIESKPNSANIWAWSFVLRPICLEEKPLVVSCVMESFVL